MIHHANWRVSSFCKTKFDQRVCLTLEADRCSFYLVFAEATIVWKDDVFLPRNVCQRCCTGDTNPIAASSGGNACHACSMILPWEIRRAPPRVVQVFLKRFRIIPAVLFEKRILQIGVLTLHPTVNNPDDHALSRQPASPSSLDIHIQARVLRTQRHLIDQVPLAIISLGSAIGRSRREVRVVWVKFRTCFRKAQKRPETESAGQFCTHAILQVPLLKSRQHSRHKLLHRSFNHRSHAFGEKRVHRRRVKPGRIAIGNKKVVAFSNQKTDRLLRIHYFKKPWLPKGKAYTRSALLLDFWRGAQASRLCASACYLGSMNSSTLISLHTAGTAMPPSCAMQSPISKRHWYYSES